MPTVLSLALAILMSAATLAQDGRTEETVTGFVKIPSNHSVAETLDRLVLELHSRGMKVFARIDFSADANEAGLEMPPTQLLIFGNPKTGTPLMTARPSAAIDLPLKALAWEDSEGNVWLSYNSPEYLAARHRLPPELVTRISGMGNLFNAVVK
jgi:uncharacterized protein (DUF302 family)